MTNKANEKVSVIVPIYNVEPYLRKCLDSLVNQKYDTIEVIMVDDCSTDNSAKIAMEYVSLYPEIFRLVKNPIRGFAAGARNLGLDYATGEWLAFVDGDDWVCEKYISSLYDVAIKDNADVVMSKIYYYYNDDKIIEVSPFGNLSTQSSQKEKIAISKPYAVTRLFRMSFVRESNLKFPMNIWRLEEQCIIIPLLTRTDKISIINESLYYYRQRTDSSSNQNNKNTDISFFEKSIDILCKNVMPGFEEEVEYRCIQELLYGLIMVMIRSNYTNKEVKCRIRSVCAKYPKWRSNKYLHHLSKGKRIFMYFACKENIIALKSLIWSWDKIKAI